MSRHVVVREIERADPDVIALDWCPDGVPTLEDIQLDVERLAELDDAFRKHVVAKTARASKSKPDCPRGHWSRPADPTYRRCLALRRIEQDIQYQYVKSLEMRWPELARPHSDVE